MVTPYHVDASVQPVVDLVIPNDGVAPRANLHAGQRVAVDIVLLQHATPIGEEVHAPLEPTVDLVIFEGGVAFSGDPHPSVRVGIDLIFDKLATPL